MAPLNTVLGEQLKKACYWQSNCIWDNVTIRS